MFEFVKKPVVALISGILLGIAGTFLGGWIVRKVRSNTATNTATPQPQPQQKVG